MVKISNAQGKSTNFFIFVFFLFRARGKVEVMTLKLLWWSIRLYKTLGQWQYLCLKVNLVIRFWILMKNDFSLSKQKANDYMETKWFRYEATIMKFWSSIPFPHPIVCLLKDIIAVKSDYRMNLALQKADALLAAQRLLLVFVGNVLYTCKTREAGVVLGYRLLRLLPLSRA